MTLERASEVEKFDRYAGSYSEAHAASVRLSGEDPAFFAAHKLGCLKRLGFQRADRVLDYGCGTGTLTRLLIREYDSVTGYDPSQRSLEVAAREAPGATFQSSTESIPAGAFEAVILSGVLHHVPPPERPAVLALAARKLAPGGRLCVFEHNPYNPLTRKAVRDCPFDDDAVLLPPREVRALLSAAGLSGVRQDYVLFFPRALAPLRPLERLLARCPLGAQTLTVGAWV
jgi:SAM-dependent methyltransferase